MWNTTNDMCGIDAFCWRGGGVTPLQGLRYLGHLTQGVALGLRVDAPLARKRPRTKGAQLISPGQRPGFPSMGQRGALKGRHPFKADHLVDTNNMVGPMQLEAREQEERIAENVMEILETA